MNKIKKTNYIIFFKSGLFVSDQAQITLEKFCAWQKSYNDLNDDALNHYDVAILITRHDICRLVLHFKYLLNFIFCF